MRTRNRERENESLFSLLLHPNRIPLFSSLNHFLRSPFPSASTRISVSPSHPRFVPSSFYSTLSLFHPRPSRDASTRPVLPFLGKVPCFLPAVPSSLYFTTLRRNPLARSPLLFFSFLFFYSLPPFSLSLSLFLPLRSIALLCARSKNVSDPCTRWPIVLLVR